MKLAEIIIKLGLAIAAVAGVAFLIVKYMDAIKAWMDKLCPVCELEEDSEEPEVEEAAEETTEEQAPVEETAEEAPAAEEVIIEEGTPVAEEKDFAE